MFALTLPQVADALGMDRPEGSLVLSGVSTDTRTVAEGDLYVALTGENFDGNQFVVEAQRKGAVAAIVSTVAANCEIPQLRVEDTRNALGLLGSWNRKQFSGPVVGVTGSAGKTSCKEMLASIFSQAGETLSTQGNLNNEIGLPKTLLELGDEHDYAVVEMGAAREGDIAYLCGFAAPTVAIVTNALPAHMESFGSLDRVASTKGEIFESLSDDGVAIVNTDDIYAAQWRTQAGSSRIVNVSLENRSADVYASSVQVTSTGCSTFTACTSQGSIDIALPLLGKHNVMNALLALAAAQQVGLSLEEIQAGLQSIRPVPGRLNPIAGLSGSLLIDDSYNANPAAVKAAIDLLSEMPGDHWVVLGVMGELGDIAESAHFEVGAHAKEKGVKRLWSVGPWADQVVSGFGAAAESFSDQESLVESLKQNIQGGETILIKGSRSAGMDHVVAALSADTQSRRVN